jgi:hypothetical protein
MKHFTRRFLIPYLKASQYRNICEIGSLGGGNIDRLLALGPNITIIDPCIFERLDLKYESNPRINVIKGLSLPVLQEISAPYDCFMIDGDHNWYTVYHELKLIHERQLLAKGGSILLHDVCWPYARRDMYYNPR